MSAPTAARPWPSPSSRCGAPCARATWRRGARGRGSSTPPTPGSPTSARPTRPCKRTGPTASTRPAPTSWLSPTSPSSRREGRRCTSRPSSTASTACPQPGRSPCAPTRSCATRRCSPTWGPCPRGTLPWSGTRTGAASTGPGHGSASARKAGSCARCPGRGAARTTRGPRASSARSRRSSTTAATGRRPRPRASMRWYRDGRLKGFREEGRMVYDTITGRRRRLGYAV